MKNFIIHGRKTSFKHNLKLVSKALQKDLKLQIATLILDRKNFWKSVFLEEKFRLKYVMFYPNMLIKFDIEIIT